MDTDMNVVLLPGHSAPQYSTDGHFFLNFERSKFRVLIHASNVDAASCKTSMLASPESLAHI